MRELFKKHFALTDKGAKDLQKASAASFFAYVINFFPAMLLLLLVDELLLNNVKAVSYTHLCRYHSARKRPDGFGTGHH